MAHTSKKQLMRALFAAGMWISGSLFASADDATLLIKAGELEETMNEAEVQFGNLRAGLIIAKLRSELEALSQEFREGENKLAIAQRTQLYLAQLTMQNAELREKERAIGLILAGSQEGSASGPVSTSSSSSSSSSSSNEGNIPPYFDDIPDLSDIEGPMPIVPFSGRQAKRVARAYESATDEDDLSDDEYQSEGEEFQDSADHSAKRPRAQVGSGRHQCDLCSNTYARKSGLNRHIKKNH